MTSIRIARAAPNVSGTLQVVSKGGYGRPVARVIHMNPTLHSRRAFSVGARWQEKHYTKQHEWIELSSDNKTATIGITTYAANALGDVVYVELPTIPQDISAGDAIGAVESVKSASDIYAPVTGKVVEANNLLEERPATINKAPEGDGWIAKMEIEGGEEGLMGSAEGELMSAEEYKKFTEGEE